MEGAGGQDNQTLPITVTQMQLSQNALFKNTLWAIEQYTLGQSDTTDNCGDSNASGAPNLRQNFSKETEVETTRQIIERK